MAKAAVDRVAVGGQHGRFRRFGQTLRGIGDRFAGTDSRHQFIMPGAGDESLGDAGIQAIGGAQTDPGERQIQPDCTGKAR